MSHLSNLFDFKILELQNMFFKQVCGFVHGLAGDGIGSKERRSKAPQPAPPQPRNRLRVPEHCIVSVRVQASHLLCAAVSGHRLKLTLIPSQV